jgi:hypothetical protein
MGDPQGIKGWDEDNPRQFLDYERDVGSPLPYAGRFLWRLYSPHQASAAVLGHVIGAPKPGGRGA